MTEEFQQKQREFNFTVPIVIEDITTHEETTQPAEVEPVEEEQDEVEAEPEIVNEHEVMLEHKKTTNVAIILSFVLLLIVLMLVLARTIYNFLKHRYLQHSSDIEKIQKAVQKEKQQDMP